MILTKEHQEMLVSDYIKEKHNQDECIGFIDGMNKILSEIDRIQRAEQKDRDDIAAKEYFCRYIV